MIEIIASLTIAGFTGVGFLTNKFQSRCADLERRSDALELKLAERYMPREEITFQLSKFEDHFLRIEAKLDNLIQHNNK